jgi:hypothetical protein
MSAIGDTHGKWRVRRVYTVGEGEDAVEWVEIVNTRNPAVSSRCPAADLPALED